MTNQIVSIQYLLHFGYYFVLLMLDIGIQAGALTPPSACYSCVSPSSHLLPAVRWQLKAGEGRVFILPFSAQSRVCHEPVVRTDSDGKFVDNGNLKLCLADQGDMCVTMTPNVKGLNYTIRGCYKQLIAHSLQQHPTLVKAAMRTMASNSSQQEQEWCYLVRGRKNPATGVQEYPFIMCLCRNTVNKDQVPGTPHVYCNGAKAPEYNPIEVLPESDNPMDDVVELTTLQKGERFVKSEFVHSKSKSGRTEAIYEVPLNGISEACVPTCWHIASLFLFNCFALLH